MRVKLGLKFAISVGLLAIIWAVFGQTLGHQFINYDDPLYVTENAHIRTGLNWQNLSWAFTHVHSQNWHPLTSISHMLDCQLFGLQPWWPHLVNVLFHSVTAVLLFLLLAEMTGNVWASAFVAALFAVHPLRVESVAWVAERKDVLSGLFFVFTLLAYFRWTQKQTIARYAATLVLFAGGLMSKPMLVTTPFVLLLLDCWPLNRSRMSEAGGQQRSNSELGIGRLIIEKIPLVILSLGSCVATLWAQNFALGSTTYLPLRWRITNAVVSYFDYIRQTFWPVDLIPFYIHPENRLELWRLLLAAAVLVGITAIAIARRRQNSYLFVGWFWYLVMLVPVIGIVQVGLQGRADRYTYLPQIGLFIALTWLVRTLTGFCLPRRSPSAKAGHHQKIVLSSAAAIVIAALSILSWKQMTYWRDTETLWRHTLAITPDSDVANAGLGGILFVRGQIDEAIDRYRGALRVRDGNVAAHYGLAKALSSERKIDEAIFHLQKALSIQPDYTAASQDLGVLFASKGELANAIAAWRQTLSFDAENSNAETDIAWVQATATDPDLRNASEALDLAQRAIRSGGETIFTLRTLAAALAENDRFPEAVSAAERAENLARQQGNQPMVESLEHCLSFYRRGEAFHPTQVSH